MRLILKDLDFPFYDSFMTIEKTEGRMAEEDSYAATCFHKKFVL